ncbi:hypothetical protein QTP70_002102 [Hemibagrus guttatus]|uniref:MAM domain-containing protein n=1 Tax=Hemibagrus guttatus TaxID=175788 RepID=A0AAE0QZY4_9TELE|nr:hypothetical protein QTP70_002102 [Hemibagrus guttatus]
MDSLWYTVFMEPGHFLFLKVRGNANRKEAAIYSPELPVTLSRQGCQLHFSMYLYGGFNGTVRLSVVENGTSVTPLVWERAGRWKDSWQDVILQITDLLNG